MHFVAEALYNAGYFTVSSFPQKKRRKKEKMKKNPVKAVMKKPAAEKERSNLPPPPQRDQSRFRPHVPPPNVVKQSPEKKAKEKFCKGKEEE